MVPGVQNTVTPGPVWIGPWTHPIPLELPVDELPALELPVDELPLELPVDELPALELPVDELPLELPVDELPLELEPKSASLPDEHPTSTSRTAPRFMPRFMRAVPSSRG